MSKYRTIVADPPWDFEWQNSSRIRRRGDGRPYVNHKAGTTLPYGTMGRAALEALPIHELADEGGSHLFLWTPDKQLLNGDAVAVVKGWGFDPLRLFVWQKTNFGLGTFPRPQHEAVIVARRGKISFGPSNIGSVQKWKNPYDGRGKVHSAKPDAFLDVVEQVSPGPYLELFARRARFGWDYAGNESLGTVEIEGLAV